MRVIYLFLWNRPYAEFCLIQWAFMPEQIRKYFGVHNCLNFDYKQIDGITGNSNRVVGQFGFQLHRALKERLT